VYRVGYLSQGTMSDVQPETRGTGFNGLRRGLRDLGWTKGGNLIIEARWAAPNIARFLDRKQSPHIPKGGAP
jgi:hypothetical protein